MRVEASGFIFEAARHPPTERVASFTSLCSVDSGAIYATFQLGSAKHALNSTIRIFRSLDGGQSWQDMAACLETSFGGVPGSLGTGELVEVAAGRLLLVCTWLDRSDPKRPMFNPETQGILRTKQLAAVSTDGGVNWDPWQELGMGELKGCTGTGPFLRWPHGIVAYPFESYKEFDDPRPGVHGAWISVSRDGGRTFGPPLLVAQDPAHRIFYWDQRLCAGTVAGELVGLFWTHDLEIKADLTVHMRRSRLNGGELRNGPMTDTGIPGQIAAPLVVDHGRLLAFVVDRGRPGTMTLWSSADQGRTWNDKLVLYVHEERAAITQGTTGIDFSEYWADMAKWSFGHPAICRLAHDKVLLAYYAGQPNCLDVHWARVDLAK